MDVDITKEITTRTTLSTSSDQQAQLNLLSAYSDAWRLTVNTSKTKAIGFRRSHHQVQEAVLTYKGHEIQQVLCIVYLGMRFHCFQAFVNANIPRIESAERAVLALRSPCAALNLYDPVVLCQLFDAPILPVIMCGLEVWGAQLGSPAMHKIEAFELAFLCRLLGCAQVPPASLLGRNLGGTRCC